MKEKILSRGAEAVIMKKNSKVIKSRIPKGYRHPKLDEKLRTKRTRSEVKILEKAYKIIPVPKILKISEEKKEIELEYLSGKKLSECLSKLKSVHSICRQIGKNLSLLHELGLIHGDLTTSNIIFNEKNKKVYFIDFGLGFHSDRAEDKAVDLYIISQALEAKHSKISKKCFKIILESYKKHSKKSEEILKRLEKVKSRGRYKTQY